MDYVEHSRQYQREYYQRNREKKLAYQRAYWEEHKDEINAARRKARHELKNQPRGIPSSNKGVYNKRYHLEVRAEQYMRERMEALQLVSGQTKPSCIACGENDYRVLVINHIDGNGREERRKAPKKEKAIRGFLLAIISGKRPADDLDVRCHNCNIRYEFERGARRLPENWQEVLQEMTGNGV